MLVILKIPVVYMCAIVWWAVRAEPRPPEGAARLAPITVPAPECDWARRRTRRLRDGRPPRRGPRAPRPARPAHARGRVRA
jgi:hypothetical protein